MKALTLTQPWASLVALGAKQIETRSWSTKYRGPLAIHAAKTLKEDDFYLIQMRPFLQALESVLDLKKPLVVYGLPLGCVIATCEITNCIKVLDKRIPEVVPVDDRIDIRLTQQFISIPPRKPEFDFGNYEPGRYAWILQNIKMLKEPIPAKGALGLWEWNEVVNG